MVFITANASKGGIHRYVAGKCSGVNCWRRGNTRGGNRGQGSSTWRRLPGEEATRGECRRSCRVNRKRSCRVNYRRSCREQLQDELPKGLQVESQEELQDALHGELWEEIATKT